MTVVAAYLYRNGQRVRPVSIDEKIDRADDKSEFVWIGIADPTEEEMHKLAGLLRPPPAGGRGCDQGRPTAQDRRL